MLSKSEDLVLNVGAGIRLVSHDPRIGVFNLA